MPVQSVQSLDFRYFIGKVFILNRKAPGGCPGLSFNLCVYYSGLRETNMHAYVIDWTWFDGVGGLTRNRGKGVAGRNKTFGGCMGGEAGFSTAMLTKA